MSDNPYQAPTPSDEIPRADFLCPLCGEACEVGLVHALGNISWFPEMTSFKMARPENLSGKTLALETKLKAFRCSHCLKIFMDYSATEPPA